MTTNENRKQSQSISVIVSFQMHLVMEYVRQVTGLDLSSCIVYLYKPASLKGLKYTW